MCESVPGIVIRSLYTHVRSDRSSFSDTMRAAVVNIRVADRSSCATITARAPSMPDMNT